MSSPDILSLTLQVLRSFLSPGRTTKIAPLTPRGIGLEALDQQRLELAASPCLRTSHVDAQTMLSALPVETLLEIIQYLTVSTIASLSTLSKSWAMFMATNESSVFRSISKRYGCISEGEEDSAAPPEGWKVWCE